MSEMLVKQYPAKEMYSFGPKAWTSSDVSTAMLKKKELDKESFSRVLNAWRADSCPDTERVSPLPLPSQETEVCPLMCLERWHPLMSIAMAPEWLWLQIKLAELPPCPSTAGRRPREREKYYHVACLCLFISAHFFAFPFLSGH